MQNVIEKSNVTVIEPSGHINAINADDFKAQLLNAVSSQTGSTVVISMANVESLDSAGLMALVAALSQAQSLDRKFLLCAVPAPIRIVFELTQLDRVFEISETYPTEAIAIAA